jgi:hypothetical protein
MKTKKTVKYLVEAALIAAIMGLIFTGCKKSKDTTATPVDDTQAQSLSAADQSRVEDEANQSMDDANSALEGVSATRSAEAFSFPTCANISVDTTQASQGLIVLTYNGNNCANTRLRSGSISVQLPYISGAVVRWHVPGASITLTFNNYKVTRLSDMKSLTFNGTHTITNVNGGLLVNITSGNPIVHKIRANMQLTFDDNTNRTWQAARTRTFSIANNIVSEQITGDTTISNYNNVAMWGTNRAGTNFYISIPTPVVENVFGGTCLYKPLSGVRVHNGLAHPVTVTYGVDTNGNPVTTGCPYGWKANWTNGQGVAKQVIVSY